VVVVAVDMAAVALVGCFKELVYSSIMALLILFLSEVVVLGQY
jgi:hypothetical protein